MKVLGICGSPRSGGNSETLLDIALATARKNGAQTEKLVLNKLKISPCQEKEYEKMGEKGLSVVNDDMKIVFDAFEGANAILIATPIFFGSVSGQTKIMVDRFHSVWLAKHVFKKEIFNSKKIGGFISVQAGDREDFFMNARSIIRNLYATLGIQYKYELFCPNVSGKHDVSAHKEYLDKAAEIGRALAGEEEGQKLA
ncbi:MAG: flavodoxin family protein [Candidatus Omnitrophica bacterium]|nr:flavodoxin family protein [Candidatus Omnitrophota bacterium]